MTVYIVENPDRGKVWVSTIRPKNFLAKSQGIV